MLKFIITLLLPLSLLASPGIKKGDMSPQVNLLTGQGGKVVIGDHKEKQILVFFRGSWCPYCMAQLKDLASNLNDKAKEKSYKLIAISTDKQTVAKKMIRKYGYPFTIASDPKAESLKAFKIANKVSDELVEKYRVSYKIDLEADSGEVHHLIAHPAVFIVNKGKVIFADVRTDYKVRTPIADIVRAL